MYIPPIEIFGGFKIGPFPVLVGIAVLVLCELAYQRAKRTGLNTRIMVDGLLWTVGVGFVMAHCTAELFSHPERVLKDPLILLMVWRGLSSVSGFLGGILAAYIYFRRKKVSFLEYFDAVMFGCPPAWIIGRLGCTIAFDHPGLPTDFFLGMMDKYGVVRHNLGFYEMLLAIGMTAVLYGLRNVRPFEGFYIALTFFLYAPVRIFLDTLRVGEKMYYGLTLGQYGSMALTALGLFVVICGLRKRSQYTEAVKTHDPI